MVPVLRKYKFWSGENSLQKLKKRLVLVIERLEQVTRMPVVQRLPVAFGLFPWKFTGFIIIYTTGSLWGLLVRAQGNGLVWKLSHSVPLWLIGNVVSLFYETMKQETGIRRYLILCWWGSGRDKRFLWRIKSSNFRFLYEAFVIVALKEDSCRNYSLVYMLYDGFIDYYVGSA